MFVRDRNKDLFRQITLFWDIRYLSIRIRYLFGQTSKYCSNKEIVKQRKGKGREDMNTLKDTDNLGYLEA